MDETMMVWYEITDKKYVQALRDAADQLEKTGYAKLYLANVTIPGDGSVNDPAYPRGSGGASGPSGFGSSWGVAGGASGAAGTSGAGGAGGGG